MKLEIKHVRTIKNVAVAIAAMSAGTLVKNVVRNNLDEPETRRGRIAEKAGLIGISVATSAAVAGVLNSEADEYFEMLDELKQTWNDGVENAKSEDPRKI